MIMNCDVKSWKRQRSGRVKLHADDDDDDDGIQARTIATFII